jgi:hypothetical protein
MKQRGRKSSSTGFVNPQTASSGEPPPAPAYLREREASEWRALHTRFGLDHFPREMLTLVGTWCAIIGDLRDINALLGEFGEGVPSGRRFGRWSDLVRLRGQLVGQATSLAVKLRIRPASREIRKRLATAYEHRADQSWPRPWEDNALPPRKNGH